MTDPRDACTMAKAIARNAGFAVFPCNQDKSPCTPHGHRDASTDPDQIDWMWDNFPGVLVAAATGEPSGFSCLDFDFEHCTAVDWYLVNKQRLALTRAYSTRSGGQHWWYQHHPGVRCSNSKLARGVDVKGTGGYVILWYCAGLVCINPGPVQPWPHWIVEALQPKKPPAPVSRMTTSRTMNSIVKFLSQAREGDRNQCLYWSAARLAERGLDLPKLQEMILPIARQIGLEEAEILRTTASAYTRISEGA